MKRSTKVKIIVFFIVFFLCFVDLRPLFRPSKPTNTVHIIDETRKSYKVGSCYNMTDDLCYFIIYLDDDESQWNEEEKEKFIDKKFSVSLNYLSHKANEYSVSICKKYATYPKDDVTKVSYDGIIEAEVVENGSQEDILSQVATSMGYSSPKKMDSTLKEKWEIAQIAYLIVVNKEGRSYKYSYTSQQNEKIEFCVFFDNSITYGQNTCYPSIAHEILHLFGAEDYYDPYGKMPEREKLAQELYPDDIMLTLPQDINNAEIGAYTAYSVGWTDILPKECDVDKWWE